MLDRYGKPSSRIHVNQMGYKATDVKIAKTTVCSGHFKVYTIEGRLVHEGRLPDDGTAVDSNSGDKPKSIDFTCITAPGTYYLESSTDRSPLFEIGSNNYQNLMQGLVKLFYYQRCGGSGIESSLVGEHFGHPPCHIGPAYYHDPEDPIYGHVQVDVSGGWHDAGDYGRYISPAAKTVADLLLTLEHFPSMAKFDFGCPQSILEEIRYELDWMLKMQNPQTGGVYHKVTTKAHAAIGILPEDDHNQLFLAPVSAPATAGFSAVMAFSARVFENEDKAFSTQCLNASLKAWEWLNTHSDMDGYCDPSFFRTGKYNDVSSFDERFWAAAELHRTTGSKVYLDYLENHQLPAFGLGWADMGTYAHMAFLTNPSADQNSSLYKRMRSQLLADAQRLLDISNKDGYGVAVEKYVWGSNMDVANSAMLFLFAYKLNTDSQYLEAAMDQIHYLLGRNPMGISYVTGYGENSAQYPHHRPSMIRKVTVPGMLVGGPNAEIHQIERDPASKLVPENTPPTKCYIDMYGSFALNEICIYWNSPLVYALGAFL